MQIDCRPELIATTMGVAWPNQTTRKRYSRIFDEEIMLDDYVYVRDIPVLLLGERRLWDCEQYTFHEEAGGVAKELVVSYSVRIVEGVERAAFRQHLLLVKRGDFWEPNPKLVTQWLWWNDTVLPEFKQRNPATWHLDEIWRLLRS